MDTDNSRLIDLYLSNIAAKGNTKRTVKIYRDMFNIFERYMDASLIDITQLKEIEYLQFLAYLRKKYNDTGINMIHTLLKSFYKFLIFEEYIYANPLEYVKVKTPSAKIPKLPTPEEVDMIINEERDTISSKRTSMILEMLYATGARVSEILRARLCDLDLDDKTLRVMGKGSKPRKLIFGERTKEKLEYYLQYIRPKLPKSTWLFPSNVGKVIYLLNIREEINRRTDKLGLMHIYPHLLRHLFATQMIGNGGNLSAIQAMLGHSNIKTTEHYTQFCPEVMKELQKKFHPLGRTKKK